MTAGQLLTSSALETLDRDQLIATVRSLLAEADALSSRIAAVNEIGVAINQSLDLDQILHVIARKAKWLLDFQHCSVCLQQPDSEWQSITLFGTPETCDTPLTETENIGVVLSTGQPVIVRYGSPSPFLSAFASQIIIPLSVEGTVTGTINFAARAPEVYSQNDLRIGYMFALQVAAAIRNASYVNQLEDAHQDLHRYAAELEARNQELDAFSHTIAHDLKSPLASILLKAEMTQNWYGHHLPPKVVDSLQGIRQQATQMSTMIDQLLVLARLRDVSVSLVPLQVEPAIRAALSRFTEALTSAGIVVHVADNLPAVIGQAQWIEEVFANLISNAIKYMGHVNPQPTITIRGQQQGDTVRYEVEDTGVGIDPESQAHLFEMFTRLQTVEAEGLGLGLSIVHRIITNLHGQVGVESTPGQGSTFWFTLPAAIDTDASDLLPVANHS